MKLLKSIRNVFTGLYVSLRRFPVTIFLSISIAVLLIAVSELKSADDTLSKIAMTLALGIPLSLSIKLFFEKRNGEKSIRLIVTYVISALLLALYYFIFLKDLNMVDFTRYIAVSLSLYLCFLLVPYFPRRENFEMYIIAVVSAFFTTLLYSLILYGGLSAILFTIDKLLGIQILSKVYYYTWLMVVFIFAVSYFLSGIPSKEKLLSSTDYPRLLRILLLYIVMPLLTAYTAILFIYFGKILLTMQWPEGLVSHLVLWYSVITAMVLFFISPIIEENNWARKFLILVPKLLLPLLVMMFISIGIRINAYGVTERRYFVVILALWVFSIMLYFSFTKKLKNIVLPFTLSIIALVSVFGPLSSFSISKYSQNNRLEKIFIQNSMLKDGNIQSNSDISKQNKADITSILDYFNRNHNLNEVKHLPADFNMEDMPKVFGFPYESPIYEHTDGYYYFSRNLQEGALDIRGYDYLFDTRYLINRNNNPAGELSAVYDYENSKVKISMGGKDIYTRDFTNFVKGLIDKHGIQQGENNLSEEEMSFEEENDKVKVKVIFLSISGRKNSINQNLENKNFDFYLMVKIK